MEEHGAEMGITCYGLMTVEAIGSEALISVQWKGFGNGSVSVGTNLAETNLTESELQSAELERGVCVITPISNGKDAINNPLEVNSHNDAVEYLERIYLGRTV
jgi:hypothetical protein